MSTRTITAYFKVHASGKFMTVLINKVCNGSTTCMNQTVTILIAHMIPFFVVNPSSEDHYYYSSSLWNKRQRFQFPGSSRLRPQLTVLRWSSRKIGAAFFNVISVCTCSTTTTSCTVHLTSHAGFFNTFKSSWQHFFLHCYSKSIVFVAVYS